MRVVRRRVLLPLLIRVAVGVPFSLTVTAGAQARPFFRTPGQAAYCYLSEGNLEPSNPVLGCWTPNDGFTVGVAHDETLPSGRRKAYVPANKKRTPSGYRLLRFGQTFRWRCTKVTTGLAENCSTKEGRTVFRCVSRRTGLTCTNRQGHGFWIGRYVGYRVF